MFTLRSPEHGINESRRFQETNKGVVFFNPLTLTPVDQLLRFWAPELTI